MKKSYGLNKLYLFVHMLLDFKIIWGMINIIVSIIIVVVAAAAAVTSLQMRRNLAAKGHAQGHTAGEWRAGT